MSNVTIATEQFNADVLVEYQEVGATTNMAGIPRFGHSSDFSLLFEAEYEHTDDYIRGLLFVGSFVIVICFLYLGLVLSFKAYEVGGFMTGQRIFVSKEQENSSHPRNIRAVFLLSGIFLIVASIMMVNKGFGSLEDTRSTVDSSLDDIRELVNEASSIAASLRSVGTEAVSVRDVLLEELSDENLCPDEPNFDELRIGSLITSNARLAVDLLQQLDDFVANDVGQLEVVLQESYATIGDVDTAVERIASQEWIFLAVGLPFVFLTSILLVGAIAGQLNVMGFGMTSFLSWCILPLFILWISFGVVLCAFMAMAASANADFCAGGEERTPDATILQAMLKSGYTEVDEEFQVARYYILQCTEAAQVDPILFLRQYDLDIVDAQNRVQELSDSIADQPIDGLSATCGRDFLPLVNSLSTMQGMLDTLKSASTSALGLLSCESIVPIYTDVVYEGTCDQSVTGIAWSFSCLLVTSVMGLIMITFRSSYQNTLYEDELLADDTSQKLDSSTDLDEIIETADSCEVELRKPKEKKPDPKAPYRFHI